MSSGHIIRTRPLLQMSQTKLMKASWMVLLIDAQCTESSGFVSPANIFKWVANVFNLFKVAEIITDKALGHMVLSQCDLLVL